MSTLKMSTAGALALLIVVACVFPRANEVDALARTLHLPVPTALLRPSAIDRGAVLRGLTFDAHDPFAVRFLSDGELTAAQRELAMSAFVTALAVPLADWWINFSPDEPTRIITKSLAQTLAGRVLLESDYQLKQLAASSRVYARGIEGASKVWITAKPSRLTDSGTSVRIDDAGLAVAAERGAVESDPALLTVEKDVVAGKRFADLRLVRRAVLLAQWYKAKLRVTSASAAFSTSLTKSVSTEERRRMWDVFSLYVRSFDKGVSDRVINGRRYFSGGVTFAAGSAVVPESADTFAAATAKMREDAFRIVPQSSSSLPPFHRAILLSLLPVQLVLDDQMSLYAEFEDGSRVHKSLTWASESYDDFLARTDLKKRLSIFSADDRGIKAIIEKVIQAGAKEDWTVWHIGGLGEIGIGLSLTSYMDDGERVGGKLVIPSYMKGTDDESISAFIQLVRYAVGTKELQLGYGVDDGFHCIQLQFKEGDPVTLRYVPSAWKNYGFRSASDVSMARLIDVLFDTIFHRHYRDLMDRAEARTGIVAAEKERAANEIKKAAEEERQQKIARKENVKRRKELQKEQKAAAQQMLIAETQRKEQEAKEKAAAQRAALEKQQEDAKKKAAEDAAQYVETSKAKTIPGRLAAVETVLLSVDEDIERLDRDLADAAALSAELSTRIAALRALGGAVDVELPADGGIADKARKSIADFVSYRAGKAKDIARLRDGIAHIAHESSAKKAVHDAGQLFSNVTTTVNGARKNFENMRQPLTVYANTLKQRLVIVEQAEEVYRQAQEEKQRRKQQATEANGRIAKNRAASIKALEQAVKVSLGARPFADVYARVFAEEYAAEKFNSEGLYTKAQAQKEIIEFSRIAASYAAAKGITPQTAAMLAYANKPYEYFVDLQTEFSSYKKQITADELGVILATEENPSKAALKLAVSRCKPGDLPAHNVRLYDKQAAALWTLARAAEFLEVHAEVIDAKIKAGDDAAYLADQRNVLRRLAEQLRGDDRGIAAFAAYAAHLLGVRVDGGRYAQLHAKGTFAVNDLRQSAEGRAIAERIASDAARKGRDVDQSQIASVLKVSDTLRNNDVLLVHGPAGNGKTSTIAEVLAYAVASGKRALVLGHTHRSVDQVFAGITAVDGKIPAVRLGMKDESISPDVRNAYWSGIAAGRKQFIEKMRASPAYGFVALGTGTGFYNDDFVASGWMTATDEQGRKELESRAKPTYDLIVIDEASQMPLPEMLYALYTATSDGKTLPEKLVILGDHNQLPVSDVDVTDLDLDKVDRDIHRKSVFEVMSDKGWFDQIMLSTNYRMNPKIARFISDVFYDGTLIVGNKNPETPDTFNVIDLGKNSGRAETLTVSENGRSTPSWANVISATKAVSRIRDIIERNGYAQKDVLVVTPYRGQKQVYTQVLKDSGLDGVRVSTIDAVQGDEAKAVVFDPVLVGTEQKSFLTKNRLLVALSRAQESLTVIGDIKGWATAKDPDVAAVFAALRKVTSSAVGGIDLSARDDMASVTPLRDIDVALPKDFEGFSYALKEPGYD